MGHRPAGSNPLATMVDQVTWAEVHLSSSFPAGSGGAILTARLIWQRSLKT
jgi:hypothetical protein